MSIARDTCVNVYLFVGMHDESFVRSSHDAGGRAAVRRRVLSSWIRHRPRPLILAAMLIVVSRLMPRDAF